MTDEVRLSAKHEQPPIDDLFEIERRNGEILIQPPQTRYPAWVRPRIIHLTFFTLYQRGIHTIGHWQMVARMRRRLSDLLFPAARLLPSFHRILHDDTRFCLYHH